MIGQTRRLAALIACTLLAGCTWVITPEAPSTAIPPDAQATRATYTDPFAYCAAVGTVESPDARYTGPEVPESLAEGLRVALNTPDTPLEVYQRGTFWRCVDGQVYACMVGANIPCTTKADLSQEPTQPMADFCQANPGSDFIPAVVTGRATVYAWRCDGTTPVAAEQVLTVDAQGFLAEYWHALPSP
jgi:hypothetical protein